MRNYANVDYSKITIEDRNPLKRKLQNLRLSHALKVLQNFSADFSGTILDYGAGNGELCKRIQTLLPSARIVCYEPSSQLREQAREHLTSYPHIHITGDLNSLLAQHFDIIFCLEVFEHLPPEVRRENLMILSNLVKREGMVVLGIPNEIFIPALLKGVLRMARRYGEDDARLGNVLRAFMGIPPRERPVVSFDGLPYILRHMGFDYREFIKEVNDVFRIMDRYGSPFPALPLLLNFEIYLKCVLPQD